MITCNIFYLNSELTAYLHNQNLAQLPNPSQYGQLSSQPKPTKAQATAFRAVAWLAEAQQHYFDMPCSLAVCTLLPPSFLALGFVLVPSLSTRTTRAGIQALGVCGHHHSIGLINIGFNRHIVGFLIKMPNETGTGNWFAGLTSGGT